MFSIFLLPFFFVFFPVIMGPSLLGVSTSGFHNGPQNLTYILGNIYNIYCTQRDSLTYVRILHIQRLSTGWLSVRQTAGGLWCTKWLRYATLTGLNGWIVPLDLKYHLTWIVLPFTPPPRFIPLSIQVISPKTVGADPNGWSTAVVCSTKFLTWTPTAWEISRKKSCDEYIDGVE